MLRRLLTCLALLTGFAAAGTPAQAHIVETEVARVEAALHEAVRAPATTATARDRTEQNAYPDASSELPRTRAKVPFAPSIHIGIDRARE